MTSYTIQKTSDHFTLNAVDSKESIKITKSHAKFDYVAAQAQLVQRIIKFNGTKMTSTKDYYKNYQQANKKTAKSVKVTFTKLDDLNIDDSLNIPMVTNTIADNFISNEGGFLPGTNVMMCGAPGVGKTTVLLELLSKLHDQGKKVLFISAEMSQIDMARYLKRFPHWGQLPILFLGDYTEECPKTVIESALNQGWDLVLTDSFSEVNDTVKDACSLSKTQTEKWFLNLLVHHNKANNKTKKYTCFVTILQLSKGGVFVGGNKLKHLTSSMCSLDWEGGENGRRFMEFSKNRCGDVGKKLYYSIGDGVEFDSGRWTRDILSDELVAEERKQLESEASSFDKLFGLGTEELEEGIAEL